MLAYTKTILEKVSFNRILFTKELRKAKNHLSNNELKQLKRWSLLTFGALYGELILEVF